MSVELFSILWIVILIAILGLLIHININLKKKFKFSTRIIISTVLVGTGFSSLLKMIVLPLVGISVYNSIINSKSKNKLKELSTKSVAYYTITVAISAIIGLIISLSLGLGKGMFLPEGIEAWAGKGEYKGIVDVIVSFIPSNIFKALTETSVVGLVIFSGFMGFATNRVGDKNPEKASLFEVMTSVTITIIKIIPYGVAALMFNLTASYGINVFKNLLLYILVMVISLIFVFIMQTINLIIHAINPIKYYQKTLPALLLAFSTTSSLGTLPLTIETLENGVGVSTGTANFTATLGTTIGMNACAGAFPAVVAVMVANMQGIPITPVFLLSLLVVIVLGSFGMAGVPGTAYIATTVVLGGMGLPFAPVALILPIDSIIDMGRTMINVNGAMVISTVIDKELGTFESKL